MVGGKGLRQDILSLSNAMATLDCLTPEAV